ncbi:MAG TPA: class I SAM-dependent methyltransferase [Bryobacteraceae bacterium]|jgi:arsenite methyltransferase|nr:class I SAM-dependent methyltransferase [Bryobacteraceae bacterium]
MPKIDYGLDAPRMVRRLSSRALLMLAVAAILYFVNRTSNPAAALPLAISLAIIGLSFAFAAVVMYLSSRVAKVKIRDLIIASIPWRGDENVLDVGCGRGLFLIGAAKHLKSGKATGIDLWNPQDLSGNTAEAALANAKAEGVEKRVKIETGDARKLPFAGQSFDVVLSSLALHNISYKTERTQALREIDRVLKPGGYLAIFDIFYTRQYAKLLEQLGFEDIRVSPLTLLWCVPTRSLTARKPA